jgi:hypothetical protein
MDGYGNLGGGREGGVGQKPRGERKIIFSLQLDRNVQFSCSLNVFLSLL